ncbi:nuclear transport factor 2 family protein [Sphingosinicella sp. CPCC 101087]|uniref:nuclear transport factor 2 family protein n=1 Tax=Sphingosinicella sp. CPCC 101087 TaxID=2497754 RepID=UPI00101B961A|nr:nuclear transport factor 2 family protein [Sphingosinicella sp. CPCC 101087]
MHDEAADTDPVRRTLLSMMTMAPAFAAGMSGAGAPARAAIGEAPTGLADAIEAYNRATTSNDVATLADLVTEDYMLVNSDATVQDKASYLADFEVQGFKIDAYEVEQPVQRTYGDAAFTAWLMRLGWTQEGLHQSRRLRIVHVWTRQEGRWRIAFTQLTRAPE